MSRRTNPPLSFATYERLFHAIHGVLRQHVERPQKACYLFATMGTYVLQRQHHPQAIAVAGAAGYRLRRDNWLILGAMHDGRIESALDAFHCWIEIDGWVVDLTAPLFGQLEIESTHGPVPPRMFQKRVQRLPCGAQVDWSVNHFHEPNLTIGSKLGQRIRNSRTAMLMALECEDRYREFGTYQAERRHPSREHRYVRIEGCW